jgi:uncharacterized membrane protein YedE/YeeE
VSGAKPAPYWNPYVCGIALGLVLLATFVIMGRGLGASGAVASVAAAGVDAAARGHARANPILGPIIEENDGSPLRAWIVFEVLGIFIGAFVSAAAARRLRRRVDRGPGIGPAGRVAAAFGGGGLMAFGAGMAGGCTSGLALTGGALLGVGAWVFMLALFAGGFAAAPLFRREWL